MLTSSSPQTRESSSSRGSSSTEPPNNLTNNWNIPNSSSSSSLLADPEYLATNPYLKMHHHNLDESWIDNQTQKVEESLNSSDSINQPPLYQIFDNMILNDNAFSINALKLREECNANILNPLLHMKHETEKNISILVKYWNTERNVYASAVKKYDKTRKIYQQKLLQFQELMSQTSHLHHPHSHDHSYNIQLTQEQEAQHQCQIEAYLDQHRQAVEIANRCYKRFKASQAKVLGAIRECTKRYEKCLRNSFVKFNQYMDSLFFTSRIHAGWCELSSYYKPGSGYVNWAKYTFREDGEFNVMENMIITGPFKVYAPDGTLPGLGASSSNTNSSSKMMVQGQASTPNSRISKMSAYHSNSSNIIGNTPSYQSREIDGSRSGTPKMSSHLSEQQMTSTFGNYKTGHHSSTDHLNDNSSNELMLDNIKTNTKSLKHGTSNLIETDNSSATSGENRNLGHNNRKNLASGVVSSSSHQPLVRQLSSTLNNITQQLPYSNQTSQSSLLTNKNDRDPANQKIDQNVSSNTSKEMINSPQSSQKTSNNKENSGGGAVGTLKRVAKGFGKRLKAQRTRSHQNMGQNSVNQESYTMLNDDVEASTRYEKHFDGYLWGFERLKFCSISV